MPNRYRTLTQVVGPINANANGSFNLDIPHDFINILKITITPTILGGSYIFQIYDRDTFVADALVYGTLPIAGVYDDPLTVDAAGNMVASSSIMAFLLPYYDKDESEELHVRIVNQDVQAKGYEVKVVFEVPSIVTV